MKTRSGCCAPSRRYAPYYCCAPYYIVVRCIVVHHIVVRRIVLCCAQKYFRDVWMKEDAPNMDNAIAVRLKALNLATKVYIKALIVALAVVVTGWGSATPVCCRVPCCPVATMQWPRGQREVRALQ